MNREKSISAEFIFILFFVFYCILPSFYILVNFYYYVFAVALYIFYVIALNKKRSISIKSIALAAVLIVAMALLYALLVNTHSISNDASYRSVKHFASKVHRFTMLFSPILFVDWAKNRATSFERRATVILSFSLLLFVVIKTTRELTLDPLIARKWLDFNNTAQDNIAGYGFVYAIPFIIVLLVYFMKMFDQVYSKVFAVIVTLFLLYFVIISQYAIAMMISFIGIMCMLFIKIKNRGLKIIVAASLPIVLLLTPLVIKFAAANVPSVSIRERLNEVYNFIMGEGEVGYNLSGRYLLYKKSVWAFLNSPIYGNKELDFDGHATFLTIFSDLGLLGGIPFCYLFYRCKKRVAAFMGGEKSDFIPFWIMLLIMGFTNPIQSTPTVSFVLWFIVPVSIMELKASKEIKKCNN